MYKSEENLHNCDGPWWLWLMEHDDVIIADIGGQAMDILLQCTQSAQKNITVKAYTQSHIYSQIFTQ